ncbi:MAG: PRC-barrel domain-containing protein [Deinococcus sp.]|nr:PRC-barrel domain-containing protein [Deinococcus sp.]
MIKGKELLGRHVVDLSTGERVDSVRDIVFDHGANLVLGLVVDGGGSWLRRRDRVIPFSAVYSVGEDAVMITSAQDTASEEEQARMKEIMDSKVNLIGMALLTSQGEDLGRIGDVVFDEYSGRVEGYEVSGGLFADATGGRSFVPAPESVQIGKDVAIVPASVAEDMRRSGGGWPASAPQEHGAAGGGDYTREELAEQAAQRQRDYLVGRVAGTTITLPDGTVVAEKGEPITDEQVTRAERSGRLMVLTSTSLDPEGSADEGPVESPAPEHTGSEDRSESPAPDQQAKAPANPAPMAEPGVTAEPDIAAEPAPTAPLSLSEMVGRRVREDVTDHQGNLLAAQGQVITPAILTRAEEQGLLGEVQQHLKGAESVSEPLDLGEYERRSAGVAWPRPAALAGAQPDLHQPHPQEAEVAPQDAAAPPLTGQEPAAPLSERADPAPEPLDPAPTAVQATGRTPALDTAPPAPEADAVVIPDQEGRLTTLPAPAANPATAPAAPFTPAPSAHPQERVMRAREEQVVHLSEPASGQEPGLLEKARRWLEDRREDLLHDPQDRELVQVHEQWGAPVAQAAEGRTKEGQANGAQPPAAPVQPPRAPLEERAAPAHTTAAEGERQVVSDPAPQLVDRTGAEARPAPTLLSVDLDLSAPALGPVAPDRSPSSSHAGPQPTPQPAPLSELSADPLQPADTRTELSEGAEGWRAELAHPAPPLQHTPQPAPAQSALSADPLQPALRPAAPATAPAPVQVATSGQQPPQPQPTPGNQAALSSEAFDQALEHIVQQAYGWPVVRTVEAKSGEVILAEGSRVTPAVVAEAKRLGALRELLSAVQRGE